ncbi:uncharacterized protein [Anabrus simplex]|uniref:uncharacterized protein n=1 Tax=Anabrus simplex TaxID=316456 RepID=UPI0035A3A536
MQRYTTMLSLLITLFVVAVSGKETLDPGQEAAVKSVFREMLKIQPPLFKSTEGNRKKPIIPPKHMLELYRKYVAGGGPRKMTGNTVRSILPSKGFAPPPSSLELLMFNVTCVAPSEEVNLAQLHLHRRRLARHQHWSSNRRVLAPPYRVRLYQLGGRGGRTTQLASVPVPHATRGGWHALDITPVLRELLLSNIQGPQLLGVRFEAPKGRPVSPGHFLKEPDRNKSDNSPAFLVVFSEESPDNGIGEDGSETRVRLVPPHTHAIVEMIQTAQNDLHFSEESIFQQSLNETPNRTDEDFYLESPDVPQNNEIDTSHRHKHKLKQYEDNDDESNDLGADLSFLNRDIEKTSERKLRRHRNHQGEAGELRRVIRSVLDNELPDAEPTPLEDIPKTSPDTLLTPRQNQRQKQKHTTIPLPPGSTSGSGKRVRGNRKRKGRGRKKGEHKKRPRHRSSDEKVNEWVPETSNVGPRSNSSNLDKEGPLCQRKRLMVDFAEFGWDTFIVSPKIFDAYYCSGACPFPLNKTLNPTNHATIQSLVHVIGREPGVPAPCCVPDQLSPISMLYLDDNQNVVLKTYPAMSVNSCACR